jgi:hypothetical protein
MQDDDLKGLVDAFKKAAKAPAGEGEEESDEEDSSEEEDTAAEDESPTEPDEAEEENTVEVEPETSQSIREAARQRALAWARRAVGNSGLVPKPKRGKRNADAAADHEQRLAAAARAFIRRLVLPGEWYLVRWGGTRKGSGSFYTRPGLALPTIRRTLEPLAYERGEDGTLIPRSPQVILALKTCDPACGSGTFPVGTLRYLTQALFLSVFHHDWLVFDEDRQSDGTTSLVIKPGPAATSQPVPAVLESLLREVRLRAIEDESRLRAWLKRLVVENCLYGVDLDPLAIELARLALWVETMDPALPFTFVDHKFRCGNGLVGAWIDTFQHYPVMAWHREGGDKAHKSGVHVAKEASTKAIKQRLDTVIRPALRSFIEETTQPVFTLLAAIYEPNHLLDQALAAFSAIHEEVDDPAAQRVAYEAWLASPHYRNLRTALDLWCALWFWPADRLDTAPTPKTFAEPSEAALAIVEELRRTHRFFHWELEFPDVFAGGTRELHAGFHALLGNPPWETQKPNSQEWFSNVDPLYRTYGKVDALKKQSEFFTTNRVVEQDWLSYNARIKALGHFTKHAAFPFGDPKAHEKDDFHFTIVTRRAVEDAQLHARWRPKRQSLASFADPSHPFRHQGSADINTYKLFTEQAHAILRGGGRCGFILPSGFYSDKGSQALRAVFISQSAWEWVFGMINWKKIFPGIYYRFKFCMVIFEKARQADHLRVAFSRYDLEDWENAERLGLDYPRSLTVKLSPNSKSLVEIRDAQDIGILDRMYSRGVLLGSRSESGWGLRYGTDFHMTGAAKLFPTLPNWESQGYLPDEYGHWLKGDWRPISSFGFVFSVLDPSTPTYERAATVTIRPGLLLSRDGAQVIRIPDIEDVALPLYEGRMIGQFDFSQKGWVSGKGRTAVWRDIPIEVKQIEPQYLMGFATLHDERLKAHLAEIRAAGGEAASKREYLRLKDQSEWMQWWRTYGCKIAFMDVASATNARTMHSTAHDYPPAGHSCPILTGQEFSGVLATISVVNSLAYDYVLRLRVGGLHLTWHYLDETPLPLKEDLRSEILGLAASLALPHPKFASWWQSVSTNRGKAWQSDWTLTEHERLRKRLILDALIAHIFGLDLASYRWLLTGCDLPQKEVGDDSADVHLDPKGFWRVDKEKDPELRHTVLAQVAYADLCAQGIDAFLTGPDGDGWPLPETLRLADYGLGHDARAGEPQPVASRLGPRFLDWQLAKDPAQSWAECEAHAAQLEALWCHARQLAGVEETSDEISSEEKDSLAPSKAKRDGGAQLELL